MLLGIAGHSSMSYLMKLKRLSRSKLMKILERENWDKIYVFSIFYASINFADFLFTTRNLIFEPISFLFQNSQNKSFTQTSREGNSIFHSNRLKYENTKQQERKKKNHHFPCLVCRRCWFIYYAVRVFSRITNNWQTQWNLINSAQHFRGDVELI